MATNEVLNPNFEGIEQGKCVPWSISEMEGGSVTLGQSQEGKERPILLIAEDNPKATASIKQVLLLARGMYRCTIAIRAEMKGGLCRVLLRSHTKWWGKHMLHWTVAEVSKSQWWQEYTIQIQLPRGVESELELSLTGPARAWLATPTLERLAEELWDPPRIAPLLSSTQSIHGEKTGFVHPEEIEGKWWLIDPQGKPLWDTGVTWVYYPRKTDRSWDLHPKYSEIITKKYPTPEAWAKKTSQDLKEWGFSSTGAGHGGEMQALSGLEGLYYYHAPFDHHYERIRQGKLTAYPLQDAQGKPDPKTAWTLFPDPFDSRWRRDYEGVVKELASSSRNDPRLIGYFVDNESIPWDMTTRFWSEACSQEFCRWLAERYRKDIQALNKAWSSPQRTFSFTSFDAIKQAKPYWKEGGSLVMQTDFLDFEERVVGEYVTFTRDVIKKHDPNHLVASHRFSGFSYSLFHNWRPMKLFGMYDLVCVNLYPMGGPYFGEVDLGVLASVHAQTRRPILLSEWNLSARDSGHYTWGWGWTVRTQEERGQGYWNCISQLASLPYVVGAHWHLLFDSLGVEDYNDGILREDGTPYEPFIAWLKKTHQVIRATPQR